MKTFWSLVKSTFGEWYGANVSRLASSLAYYTVFSITPLLLIATAIVGWIFGPDAAQSQVSSQLRDLLGASAAEVVESTIKSANQDQKGSILATVLGVLLLAYGATNVFAALQDSLNTIWGVKTKPDVGLWYTVRLRLLSFGMVVATGFLLLVSLLLSAGLSAATKYLSDGSSQAALWNAANVAVSIVVFTAMFGLIYNVLPDVEIPWQDVSIGAFITALLFSAGKFLIGLYLGHSSVASAYGAAGSLVLLLLWVYYSAQILFVGAVFTKVYASRRGHFAVASAHAVPVTSEARAREGLAPAR